MIRAVDLEVRLKARSVLSGVSLTAAAGSVTALVGPNGAGKSTLLKTLAGLITPDAGVIFIADRSFGDYSIDARARVLSYLPQDREVHWPLPVRGIVSLGRIPHQSRGPDALAADRIAIDDAMRAMDVMHLAGRPVLELSGGERARVLMARSLAQAPRVLLADEPTAGLDPAHQLQLFRHLREMAGSGIAVVVALHDLSLAARFADQVLLMKSGQIAASGAPADVLKSAILEPVYGVRMLATTVAGVPILLPHELLP